MSKMSIEELIKLAIGARNFSYSPYSSYKVGAALLCKNRKVYTGCNIENAAFTPGICAERTAISKAVSEGEKDFEMIVVVGGKKDADKENLDHCTPCGVCRQVIREFCSDDFKIVCARSSKEYKIYTLKEILPDSFGPDNVK